MFRRIRQVKGEKRGRGEEMPLNFVFIATCGQQMLNNSIDTVLIKLLDMKLFNSTTLYKTAQCMHITSLKL